MGVSSQGESAQAAVSDLLDELLALNVDLEVPSPKDYGIEPQRWSGLVETMAAQALASGSPANDPRVPSRLEIQQLYQQIWT